MDRDQLRQELLLTFVERGGEQTPRSLARYIGADVSPGAVRSVLVNLQREGAVRKVEGYTGTTWELEEATVRDRIASSLQADDHSSEPPDNA
jgi:DeoR/GlpR family transcriptional regulator of sugar metabolism